MKKFFLTFSIIFSTLVSLAQNYFLVDVGGGINTLIYQTDSLANRKNGLGFTFRAGYRHFFKNNFGLGINVAIKSNLTYCTLNGLIINPLAVDSEGEEYEHRTNYNSLKEKQNQINVSLPIGIYYRIKKSKNNLIFGVGAIAQNTISNKYKTTDGTIETTGFYAEDNIIFDELPQHDFFKINSFSGKYDYKSSLGAFGEVDFLHQINKKLSLTISLYGSYGINNSTDDKTNELYNYKKLTYEGVLNSSIAKNTHQAAAGILFGICFNFNGGKGSVSCPAYGNGY